MSTGTELIAAERQRQVDVEGWTPDHDAGHATGDLAAAAICYLGLAVRQADGGPVNAAAWVQEYVPEDWPWDRQWWKPSEDPARNLVKAGALVAAEIDRLAGQHD